MPTREDVVRVARSYAGTPWFHMGRKPGIALDCAGLLICVGRELGIFAADFDVPNYVTTPDGSMLPTIDKYMTRIARSEIQIGDAVAIITDVDPQHLGIVTPYRYGGFQIVHASNYHVHPKVIETRMMFSRKFRFAAAWKFPGID